MENLNLYDFISASFHGTLSTSEYAITMIAIYGVTGAGWVFVWVGTKYSLISGEEVCELVGCKEPAEISRKALCACGSGKKYKTCCGSDAGKTRLILSKIHENERRFFLLFGKRFNAQLYYLYYPIFWIEQRLMFRRYKNEIRKREKE